MSHKETTYIDEDSISLPEGHVTPPESLHGGDSASIKQMTPLSQRGLDMRRVSHSNSLGHGQLVLSRWHRFLDVITGRNEDLVIDGQSLDLAAIVAVAR